MRRCFAFDDDDTSLSLVDERGCVIEKLMSEFTYDQEKGTADATIFSMFRFGHQNLALFLCRSFAMQSFSLISGCLTRIEPIFNVM